MDLSQKDLLEEYLFNHTNIEAAIHFGVARDTIRRYRKKWSLSNHLIKTKRTYLSSGQLDRLLGNLLGDGCLEKYKINRFSRFFFGQCKERAEYVEWRKNDLDVFCKKSHECKNRKPGILNGKASYKVIGEGFHYSKRFGTINHPIFTDLEAKWYLRNDFGKYVINEYGKRIKCVPGDLKLTWEMAAIWFADDGSNNYKKRYVALHTNGFRDEDVELLKGKLKNNLGIESKIWRYGGKPVLGISNKMYVLFMKNITPYLQHLKCMGKKLFIGPPGCIGWGAGKLNLEKARLIRKLYETDQYTLKQLAEKFDVTHSAIGKVVNQITYREADVLISGKTEIVIHT